MFSQIKIHTVYFSYLRDFKLKSNLLYRSIIHCIAAILLAYSVFTAIKGIEVGRHWDEVAILDQVQLMIDNGNLLPGRYTYSSISYLLPVIPLIPHAADIMNEADIKNLPDSEKSFAIQEKLRKVVKYDPDPKSTKESHTYLIHSRILYIVLTYLSIIWIYLAVLSWRNNPLEALLAAAIFALSWEINYHSRWIMPDAIMMQFAALSMMFLVFTIKKNIKVYLYLSAIAAAFAVGTKYNAGLLLASILIVPLIWKEGDKSISFKNKLTFLFITLLSFSIAYFFSTPGTLFDPIRFVVDFYEVMTHYGDRGHEGYTIHSTLEHLARLTVFFSTTALSYHFIISLILFTFSAIGFYALIKKDSKILWISFLAFPVIYFAFHATQKVMFVRNILVLIPFLSILSARGIFYIHERYLKNTTYNFVLIILIFVMLGINSFWLYHSAESIARPKDPIDQLIHHINEHPDTKYYISKSVQTRISKRLGEKPKIVLTGKTTTDKKANAEKAVFNSMDVHYYGKRSEMPSNRYNYYTWFGPKEINYNYYSTWRGEEFLVIAPFSSFLKLNINEK